MARLFMTVTDRQPRLPSEPLLRLSGSFGGRHPRMFKPESWVTSSVFWEHKPDRTIIADAVYLRDCSGHPVHFRLPCPGQVLFVCRTFKPVYSLHSRIRNEKRACVWGSAFHLSPILPTRGSASTRHSAGMPISRRDGSSAQAQVDLLTQRKPA